MSYVWKFGDGSTGSGENPSHTYGAVGSYTAVVTATNGVSEVVASTQVSVIDRVITGTAVTNSGPTPLGSVTTFNVTIADGSGSINYAWDFGDGTTGSGVTPSHTYAAVGVYTAVVTATNSVGQAAASTQVTIIDQSISGLQMARSGGSQPVLGSVAFTATTVMGSNINYSWSLAWISHVENRIEGIKFASVSGRSGARTVRSSGSGEAVMRWRPLDASPAYRVTDWRLPVEPAQQRMPSGNRCVGDVAVAPDSAFG